MNTHTNAQIIEQNGKPIFAVLPYNEYINLVEDNIYLPHEVVGMTAIDGYSTYKAWRTHLNIKQAEVAEKMGITQSAVAKIEANPEKISNQNRVKFAKALGINARQLDDD